jgi:hypothetical protein
LLQKPELAPAHLASEPGTGAANANHEAEKRTDVFKPPYNPNLYVGELRDEEESNEYVVLVSGMHDPPHHHHLTNPIITLIDSSVVTRHDQRDTYAFAFVQLNKYSVVEEHFLLVTKGAFLVGTEVIAACFDAAF